MTRKPEFFYRRSKFAYNNSDLKYFDGQQILYNQIEQSFLYEKLIDFNLYDVSLKSGLIAFVMSCRRDKK